MSKFKYNDTSLIITSFYSSSTRPSTLNERPEQCAAASTCSDLTTEFKPDPSVADFYGDISSCYAACAADPTMYLCQYDTSTFGCYGGSSCGTQTAAPTSDVWNANGVSARVMHHALSYDVIRSILIGPWSQNSTNMYVSSPSSGPLFYGDGFADPSAHKRSSRSSVRTNICLLNKSWAAYELRSHLVHPLIFYPSLVHDITNQS